MRFTRTEHEAFIAEGLPSKTDVRAFAGRLDISPSIVAGRLRHDGVIPRTWMHDLHVRLDWDR